MTPLFAKLNLGTNTTIHVLNAPESFASELKQLEGVSVKRRVSAPVHFAIAFAKTMAELDECSASLTAAIEGDSIVWIAYPKGSSKKYKCEFNRDSGWQVLGSAGFEPVRQIAIDEDWSALRFRRAEYIKSLKRNPDGAISDLGRARAKRRDA